VPLKGCSRTVAQTTLPCPGRSVVEREPPLAARQHCKRLVAGRFAPEHFPNRLGGRPTRGQPRLWVYFSEHPPVVTFPPLKHDVAAPALTHRAIVAPCRDRSVQGTFLHTRAGEHGLASDDLGRVRVEQRRHICVRLVNRLDQRRYPWRHDQQVLRLGISCVSIRVRRASPREYR
jgi:hypothetical protein